MPKNGVNTCPPISEYEIINAPKFTPDYDDLFIITFLLVKNYYQIQTTLTLILASQKIPQIFQPPAPNHRENHPSAKHYCQGGLRMTY